MENWGDRMVLVMESNVHGGAVLCRVAAVEIEAACQSLWRGRR